jgi:predicted benzoate:H+ symporter BenE
MVVSALVAAVVLYFAHNLLTPSGAFFILAAMIAGFLLNRLVTKTSPSIVAVYPTYLKQNRGQSTLKIEFSAVAHCRWSITPELTVLEVIGKDGWVMPVALRKSTPKEKVQAALERVGVEVK